MRHCKNAVKLTCVFVLISMLISVLLLPAEAASAGYDFSRLGSSSNTNYTASDFLNEILSVDLSDEEERYVDLYSDFSFSHPSNISTAYVTTVYDEERESLHVDAYEYSYKAENGVTVIWKPESVTLGENKSELLPSDDIHGAYSAEYDNVILGDNNAVSVRFVAEFVISADSVNELLNLAYNDAKRLRLIISEKEKEYKALKEQYDSDLSLYEAYLAALSEYESQLAVYKEYLVAKRIYDDKYAAYMDYLAEEEEYLKAKAEYDNYLLELQKYNEDYARYRAYLDFLTNYQAKIEAYEKYCRDIERVRMQLAVIDAAKTPVTSLKRTVYDAIMGDTVTTVIANKDLIASEFGKADPEVIDLADKATKALRELLTDYFSYTDEEGRYTYYYNNYEDIKNNFIYLLQALDNLYLVSRIRGVMIAQEKQEKYLILLAQLYCIANALSDESIKNYDGSAYFDSSYIIGKNYKKGTSYSDAAKPEEILGSIYIKDNNNAAPLDEGYPTAVEKPEYTVVEEPIKPAAVKKPTAPEPVSEPGAIPDVVDEPTAPEAVTHPGDEPMPYEPPEGLLEIIELYDSGALTEREELTLDFTYTASINVNKKYYGATEVNVTYFDTEGNLLYFSQIESGTYADFEGELPGKAEDDSATYSFKGWVDSEGRVPDLTCVTSDLNLYPTFEPHYKSYDITWVVGDESVTESLVWGTLPSYGKVPVLSETSDTYFVFENWDRQIEAVNSDAVYTAVFKEIYYVPFASGGGASIDYVDGIFNVDCRGSYSKTVKISELIRRAAGEGGVKLITYYGDLSLTYSEALALSELDASEMKISAVQAGTGNYKYSIHIYDSAGNEIFDEIKARVTLPCVTSDHDNLFVYQQDKNSDSRKSVKYGYTESHITFDAIIGVSYLALHEYTLNVIPSELVGLTVDKEVCLEGERVKIKIDCPMGVNLKGVYYVDSSGSKIRIEGAYFTMPNCSISLCADAERIEYTVKFVSDGKVISSRVAYYGDTVLPPSDPKKVSDGEFTYEFVGWSSEIATVTGDAVYTAVYNAIPVPPKVDDGSLQITDNVMKYLVLAGALGSVFLFIILPSAVMSTVLGVKRRKNLKEKKPRPV